MVIQFRFNMDRRGQWGLKQLEVERLRTSKRAVSASIDWALKEQADGIKVFGAEKSFEIGQFEVESAVKQTASRKVFELKLEHGPYHVDYSRNGQYLALCGEGGHLAMIRWRDFRVISEQHIGGDHEWVFDAIFAADESMLCVAQREGVYVVSF